MAKQKPFAGDNNQSHLSAGYQLIRSWLPNSYGKWFAVAVGLAFGLFYYPELRQSWHRFVPKPGSIYVESPEIYTRERMINERLTEDTWLRDQLEAAGRLEISAPGRKDSEDGRSGVQLQRNKTVSTKSTGGRTDASSQGRKESKPAARASKTQGQPPANATKKTQTLADIAGLELAFGQVFKLRSAARSLVRQRLIENRLDDRHDIDENTLYVLKFDTTVVDAPVNRRRAKVEVEISGPRGKPVQLATFTSEDGTPRIRGPLKDEEITKIYLDDPDTIELMHTTYNNWLNNVKYRIIEEAFRRSKQHKKNNKHLNISWRNKLKEEYEIKNKVVNQLNELEARRVYFAIEAMRTVLEIQEGFFSVYFEEDDLTVNVKNAEGNTQIPRRKTITVSVGALRQYAHTNVVLAPSSTDEAEGYVDFPPRTHSVTVANKGCLQAKYDQKAPIFYLGDFVIPGKDDQSQGLQMIVYGPAERVGVAEPTDFSLWPRTLIEKVQKAQKNRPAIKNRLVVKDPLGLYSDMTSLIREGFIPGLPGLPIADPDHTKNNCHLVLPLTLNTGFIAFLRKMLRHRSFSYSVLPRDSAVVTLNEMKRVLDIQIGAGTANGAAIRSADEEASVELKPTLATFGETAKDGQNPVVGWIIDPAASFPSMVRRSDYVTVSESVLAIVSVPAWWPELNLQISRSWIDRRGSHKSQENEGGPSRKITVALPKNDRVLDTQLFGTLRKKPKIDFIEVGYPDPGSWRQACDRLLEQRTDEKAARPTSILIRGSRLWRNTVVTVGGRRANQIELMPDMNGVIAYFECPIDFDRKASVAVWTSEGSDIVQICEAPDTEGERPWACESTGQQLIASPRRAKKPAKQILRVPAQN